MLLVVGDEFIEIGCGTLEDLLRAICARPKFREADSSKRRECGKVARQGSLDNGPTSRLYCISETFIGLRVILDHTVEIGTRALGRIDPRSRRGRRVC